MQGHLITLRGESREITPGAVKELIDTSTRFWLDLEGLDHESAEMLLRGTFGLHPLAAEDMEQFHQRPKVDGYDRHTLMVVYGATPTPSLVEVNCYLTATYLVTVHHDPYPELTHLADRLQQGGIAKPDPVVVLYRVLDTLIDGFFPVLASLDDDIDELEDAILDRPTDQQLGRLFDMKRSLIAIRKVVTPQRDMFATLASGGDALPGMSPEAEPYFRDLYDHLIRISDLVDSYRDLITGVLDTHISTVSNRLNVVMKQLTIIATIFLPLSFLTGFFGQNFGWMVDRLASPEVFFGAGVGLQVLVVVGLLMVFRQRGWLGSSGSVPSPTPADRQRLTGHQRWHLLRGIGRPPVHR